MPQFICVFTLRIARHMNEHAENKLVYSLSNRHALNAMRMFKKPAYKFLVVSAGHDVHT